MNCGAPNEDCAKAQEVHAGDKKPTTIQQTSKKWKRLEVLGVIVMAMGIVLLIMRFTGLVNQGMPVDAAVINTIETRIIWALFFLIPGLGIFAFARGMKWWHHG